MEENKLDEQEARRQLLILKKWMSQKQEKGLIARLIRYFKMYAESIGSGGGIILTLYLRWYFDNIFGLVKKEGFFDSDEGTIVQDIIAGDGVPDIRRINMVWICLGIAVACFVGIVLFFNLYVMRL